MPLDHVMFKVKDWPKAKAYYTTALKPLGYEPIADWGTGGGFQVPGEKLGFIYVRQEEKPGRLHIAISAPSAEAVSEFYKVAVAAGGTENGAPGPRAHIPAGGVGTFVIDLDDNNIEVVYRP